MEARVESADLAQAVLDCHAGYLEHRGNLLDAVVRKRLEDITGRDIVNRVSEHYLVAPVGRDRLPLSPAPAWPAAAGRRPPPAHVQGRGGHVSLLFRRGRSAHWNGRNIGRAHRVPGAPCGGGGGGPHVRCFVHPLLLRSLTARDPTALWRHAAGGGRRSMLIDTSAALYDDLRPHVVTETHMDTLCELVHVVREEVVEEQVLPQGALALRSAGTAHRLLTPLPWDAGRAVRALLPTLRRIEGDVQERLLFRVERYVADGIIGWQPTEEALDYPPRLLRVYRPPPSKQAPTHLGS